MEALMECERQKALLAQQIYDAREKRGLSESQLAHLVGVSVDEVVQLQEADFDDSLYPILNKVVKELGLSETLNQ